MKLIALTFTTFLFTFSAQARDIHEFRSLGFSTDSSKYAFLQHVTQDGSGFPEARIIIMDVATGNEVRNERVILEDEGKTEKEAIEEALVKVDLKSYGIDGTNDGSMLLNRLNSDRSAYTDTAFATGYYQTYTLSTSATKVPIAADSYCIVEPELLKLELKNEDPSAPMQIILANEAGLHADRSCAYNHNVSKVIIAKDALVVIMSYQSTGFEGPDTDFMAIVKKIDLP